MLFKNCRCPHRFPQFLGSKEGTMVCALRRYGVTDSGNNVVSQIKRILR
ncbi:MAG: hypothetical protein P8X79_12095 [Reinekea sp.]